MSVPQSSRRRSAWACICILAAIMAVGLASARSAAGQAAVPEPERADLLAAAADITCDVPVTDVIESPTDSGFFDFSVGNGEIVHITVQEVPPVPANFQASWRLLDGTGSPAADCGSFSTLAENDCGPLPAAGSPYRMEVEDFGHDAGGSYRVHMQRLTVGATCEDQALGCDAPAASSIEDAVDSDLFSFNVAQGEIVQITIQEAAPVPANFQASWRLLDSAGSPAPDCGSFSTIEENDCGPLPAAGSPYRIEVEDFGHDAGGGYLVYLQRLTVGATCEDQALSCDVPASSTIDNAVDSDFFSFSVGNGEIVHVTVQEVPPVPASFQASWRLLDSAGSPAPDCGFYSTIEENDCGPLPAAGSPYRIEMEDFSHDAGGSYRVRLQRLTVGATCEDQALGCDAPATSSIEHAVDSDLFSFGVGEGEIVQITLQEVPPVPANFQASWRLLDGAGSPAPDCGSFSILAENDCGPLPAAGSPYRIEVEDFGQDAAGSYWVTMQRLTVGATCDDQALGCDIPTTSTVDHALDSDLFSFSVAEGEIVHITTQEVAPVPANFQASWRLLDGAGSPAPDCGFYSTIEENDCGPLPAAGSPYRIEVEDFGHDARGSYRLRRQPLIGQCPSLPRAYLPLVLRGP